MSQDATVQNLKIRRGDDWGDEVTLECINGDGAPLDITGAEIWFTVRKKTVRDITATDASNPPVLQLTTPAVAGGAGGLTILDGPAGTARPVLTPTQTKLLVAKTYVYDVQVRPAVGPLAGKIKTTQTGSIQPLDEQTLGV